MRLDKYLVETGFFVSREKAQLAIKEGRVFVNGKIGKSSTILSESDKVEVRAGDEYVSRGAYKLIGAQTIFGVNFFDKVVLDIGASTGGFTQVALLGGAKKVYALDIGHGQLDQRLVKNDRVVDLSGLDFRASKKLDDVNLIVSDLSFISLRHILPKITEEYPQIEAVLLFKPQFECGEVLARKYKGVVLDKKLHMNLLSDFVSYLSSLPVTISGLTSSPITGKNGNIEYLIHLNTINKAIDVKKVVDEAFDKIKKN